ncbi:hypothetical protein [Actinophytocola sp.]|uniref:hypothetical protein n=1 Tax=Actinophytocola sp. TaxID=1872138 RepID=UPI0038999951
MGTEVRWRAWLGVGDESRFSQIDIAEFATCSAACAWVERRLYAESTRPGLAVFGSVDRGVYRETAPGAPRWIMDPCSVGMDADLVDGQVCWRRPTGRRA